MAAVRERHSYQKRSRWRAPYLGDSRLVLVGKALGVHVEEAAMSQLRQDLAHGGIQFVAGDEVLLRQQRDIALAGLWQHYTPVRVTRSCGNWAGALYWGRANRWQAVKTG